MPTFVACHASLYTIEMGDTRHHVALALFGVNNDSILAHRAGDEIGEPRLDDILNMSHNYLTPTNRDELVAWAKRNMWPPAYLLFKTFIEKYAHMAYKLEFVVDHPQPARVTSGVFRMAA
jgi:hypothetical protein